MSSRHGAGDEVGQTRWESVVDKAIAEAQRRGDFDDLPGAGQPLRLEDFPFAGDQAMAFHALKSAGVVPHWMELGREVQEELAALKEVRERAARYLQEQFATRTGGDAAAGSEAPAGRVESGSPVKGRWPFRRRPSSRERPTNRPRVRLGVNALEAERQRARARYLARAAALDRKIRAYNAALPNDLWRLHRGRLTPDEAAQAFDAACPPITSEPVEKS